MKNLITLSIVLFLIISCASEPKEINKVWLDQPIDFGQLKEVVHTYHMFDSTDKKVGSMIFGFAFENGMLVVRDTSQFDDESVYETAEFIFDTSNFKMKSVAINLSTTNAMVDIDIEQSSKVTGTYMLTRDSVTNKFPIDSVYQHDVLRSEMYMLFHTLQMKTNDSISFKALAPTSMAVSQASLTYDGIETIKIASGSYDCNVLWLKTDGIIPSNKIWISREEPRKVVKFYVPGPELDIELVTSKLSDI